MKTSSILAGPFATLFAVVALLLGLSACGDHDRAEKIGVAQSALVPAMQVLGFEATAHWSAAAPLSSSTERTQGLRSLGVRAAGYVTVTSVPLPAPVAVGSTISVDLELPTAQANPHWFGALQVYFESPSANVYNAYVGQVELTGFPTGAFHTLHLAVPPALRASLNPQATDFRIKIALNVPTNSTGTYLLDNFVLAPAVSACNAQNEGARCDDGNVCTNTDRCTAGACRGIPISSCALDPSGQGGSVNWNRQIVLDAFLPVCGNTNTSVTLPTVEPLKIPATVSMRGKASTTIALTLTRPSGQKIECRYSAPSSSHTNPRPATFVSCNDGSTAGTVLQAMTYQLAIVSAAGVPPTGNGVCSQSPVSATIPLGIDSLPVLAEPLSAAETTALRQSFAWTNTTPLAELDSEGRSLLYYALVYIENNDQVGFLDDLEIHHDFLPIFEGLERWRGQRGVFVHHGNGDGVYTFAVMSGSQYNFLRSNALAGTEIFRAVNLRTPPPAFVNPDGKSLSYRALGNIRFHYMGVDPVVAAQQPPLAPILCTGDTGGVVREGVQAGAELYRDAKNLISGWIGRGTGAVTGTVNAFFEFRLFNTDPTFQNPDPAAFPGGVPVTTAITSRAGFRPTRLVQSWGIAANQPIHPEGALLEARGVTVPSYRSTHLDNGGRSPLTLNEGLSSAICLLPKNGAADLIDFITTAHMCDFGSYELTASTPPAQRSFRFDVENAYLNIFAQMIDSKNFSTFVQGFSPRTIEVLVGRFADHVPNPITPCFSLNLSFSQVAPTLLSVLGAIHELVDLDPAAAAALAAVGSCVYEVDMVMPSEDGWARSRGVATHEYGHWQMCNLLGRDGVSTAYTAAILEILEPFQPVEVLGECNHACGNEAYADFFAAQVTGGTGYYRFNDSIDDASGFEDETRFAYMKYCPSASNACFEDNVGGPSQRSCGHDPMIWGPCTQDVRRQNKGRTTSIFHDFIDGNHDLGQLTMSNGNFVTDAATVPGLPSLTFTPMFGGSAGDELVQLPGSLVSAAIQNRDGISIDQDALFKGLVAQARARNVTWCELCELFARHNEHSCEQVPGTPVCNANFCPPVAGAPACTPLEEDAMLFAACQRSFNITKWIGNPPSSTDPASCTFVPSTTCPAGQVPNQIGVCVTPPCAGGLVLDIDGVCKTDCMPQTVGGTTTVPPASGGVCLIVVR